MPSSDALWYISNYTRARKGSKSGSSCWTEKTSTLLVLKVPASLDEGYYSLLMAHFWWASHMDVCRATALVCQSVPVRLQGWRHAPDACVSARPTSPSAPSWELKLALDPHRLLLSNSCWPALVCLVCMSLHALNSSAQWRDGIPGDISRAYCRINVCCINKLWFTALSTLLTPLAKKQSKQITTALSRHSAEQFWSKEQHVFLITIQSPEVQMQRRGKEKGEKFSTLENGISCGKIHYRELEQVLTVNEQQSAEKLGYMGLLVTDDFAFIIACFLLIYSLWILWLLILTLLWKAINVITESYEWIWCWALER